MVTLFEYVEGGPDREAPEDPGGNMRYQFIYLNIYIITVYINKWDSVYLNGWVGQGKPSRGSLKYFIFKNLYI